MADGYLRLQEYTRRQQKARRFSMQRVIHECSTGGLRSGFEHEVCAEAAHVAEKPYDMHRPLIPWSALRDPLPRRDVAVSASGGGYFVESEVPAEVVDILRPVSVVVAAGVTVWPNLVGNQTVAHETAAATGYWVNESVAVTESQPTFSQSALVPRTGGVYVERSRLLNLNSANADAALRNDLLRTTGALIDVGCLNGSGAAGQPVGLLNIAGVGSQSGTSLAWAGVLNMLETCATANANDAAISYVATPAVRELLQQREIVSTSGRMIWANDAIEGRRAMVSTNLPAGSMVCGDWSRAILGLWGPGPQIEINPYAQFAAGIVGMRILVHCDIGVMNATAFCKSTSIT